MSKAIIKRLFFSDLVILNVVKENAREDLGVLLPRLPELCNSWLTKNSVPVNYSTPVNTLRPEIKRSIHWMIANDFLYRVGPRSGVDITAKGVAFLTSLGDDWRKYPLAIPVVNNKRIDFEQAVYAQAFRSEL